MKVVPFRMFGGESGGSRVCLLRNGRLIFCERLEPIARVGRSGLTQQSNRDLR